MRIYRTFVMLMCCLLPVTAQAQSLLLDAEAMDYLKTMATPLLKAADIPPETTQIFIINSPQINAFVTPERRIYFYTGLIEKAENYNQLQGVLAHEIGHIKGRHHLKAMAMQDKMKWPALIGAIVGVGAMAAAGGGAAGQAILTAGLATSATNTLKFTRGQEQQADQIGLQLLNSTQTSPLGLAQFFNILQVESTLFARTPPAYLLTHPMPSARLDFIRQYLPKLDTATPDQARIDEFNRIKAKIMAFTNTPGQTLRQYMQDTSETALYAKTVAYALQGKKKESYNLINQLIAKRPNDYFYRELKAQLLVDHGDVKEAVDIYSEIIKEREDLPLVQLQYADALVAMNKASEALPYYHRVLRVFPEWGGIHRRLGVAYGKSGEMAASHISLTQEAILDKKLEEAQLHLNTAAKYLDTANAATKQRFALLKEALAEARDE